MTETTETSARESKDVIETKEETTLSPFDELDKLFQELTPWRPFRSMRDIWPTFADLESRLETRIPKVDVIDKDDNIIINAEIPGIDKKDIDISLTDNAVTIKGESKSETREEKESYIHCEIRRGSFYRTVPLPCSIDADSASATFKDGMLELTLPKTGKPAKKTIEVK